MESEEDEDQAEDGSGSMEDWSYFVRELQNRLGDLQTRYDLISKHSQSLHRALVELESTDDPDAAQSKSKMVKERATLFRIASSAMMNVSLHCVNNIR